MEVFHLFIVDLTCMMVVKKQNGNINKQKILRQMHKIRRKVRIGLVIFGLLAFSKWGISQTELKIQKDSVRFDSLLSTLSFKPSFNLPQSSKFTTNSFDASTLPVFCKIEHKIESVSKIAFRFRLGELNYVNMLENKQ